MIATTIELESRQTIALPDIEGTALAVRSGTLWITQENETRDVVLGPGDLWMVERDGLTIIEAQNDARFSAIGRAFDRKWKATHEAPWWSRIFGTPGSALDARRWVPYY